MLTDADKDGLRKRTDSEIEGLEDELLAVAASQMTKLDGFDSYSVASGIGSVSVGAASVVGKRRQRIANAIKADLSDEFELNATRESQIADAAGQPIAKQVLRTTTSEAVRSAYSAVSRQVASLLENAARGTVNAYVTACEVSAIQVSRIGTDRAMKNAITYLAERGITATSYTRKDGVTVNVPVDVGIRRAMVNAGQRGRMEQTLAIARAAGHDLVEVNVTANARESHAQWQGEIYSLSGRSDKYKQFSTSCNVGDPVDGIGGYNCGHEVAMYYEGYGRTFSDPLEGTGYTTEEVRELTTKQRALEREIRATKREAEVLRRTGYSVSEQNARIRQKQDELRSLIADNKAVLFDQKSRVSVPGIRSNAVFLSNVSKENVISSAARQDAIAISEALKPIKIKLSVGAQSKDIPVILYRDPVTRMNVLGRLTKGEELRPTKVIAGRGTKTKIKQASHVTKLAKKELGVHVNEKEWQKVIGFGKVDMPNGNSDKCELHWYFSKQTGPFQVKIKRNIDDPNWEGFL